MDTIEKQNTLYSVQSPLRGAFHVWIRLPKTKWDFLHSSSSDCVWLRIAEMQNPPRSLLASHGGAIPERMFRRMTFFLFTPLLIRSCRATFIASGKDFKQGHCQFGLHIKNITCKNCPATGNPEMNTPEYLSPWSPQHPACLDQHLRKRLGQIWPIIGNCWIIIKEVPSCPVPPTFPLWSAAQIVSDQWKGKFKKSQKDNFVLHICTYTVFFSLIDPTLNLPSVDQ